MAPAMKRPAKRRRIPEEFDISKTHQGVIVTRIELMNRPKSSITILAPG